MKNFKKELVMADYGGSRNNILRRFTQEVALVLIIHFFLVNMQILGYSPSEAGVTLINMGMVSKSYGI